jgi:hypothetical protein
MKLVTILVALAAVAVVPAFAQNGTFAIKYVANLTVGDSFINVSNSGDVQGLNLNRAIGFPSQTARSGNICVNIYVFSPDEQEQECCSCLLTPNGLATFSARNDLTTNTLTGRALQDVVIKLVATASCTPQPNGGCFPQSSPTDCNASTAGLSPTVLPTEVVSIGFPSGPVGQTLAPGMRAWGTTLHANTTTSPVSYQVTETGFEEGDLSSGELNRITGLCANIQQNGSGAGICARDHGLCVTAGPPALR